MAQASRVAQMMASATRLTQMFLFQSTQASSGSSTYLQLPPRLPGTQASMILLVSFLRHQKSTRIHLLLDHLTALSQESCLLIKDLTTEGPGVGAFIIFP